MRMRGAASYAMLSERRISTQTAAGSVDPIRYSLFSASADTDFRMTDVTASVGLNFNQFDFDDGVAISDLSEIDQDFRDRKQYTARARSAFRIRPAISLFSAASYQVSEYSSPRPGTAIFQDSERYVLSGGVAFDINKVARGEISAGYESQNFDAAEFSDVSGANVSAQVEYFPTGLTTITLGADRSVEDSATLGSDGAFVSNRLNLRVDHELLRQMVVSISGSYEDDEFRGFDRRDKLFSARFAIRYMLGAQTLVELEYSYVDLTSSGGFARSGYERNAIGLNVEYRL
jgi:hypothetical protein